MTKKGDIRRLNQWKKGKQEFRRTDFGSRLLAAESEAVADSEGERCVWVKQYPSGSG